jgi:hypothetical protein
MLKLGAEKQDVAGCEIENRGEVGKIADPINPGGKKTGSFAEGFFGPNIKTPFRGITRGQKEDGKYERDIQQKPAEKPDNQRGGAVTGGGGDPTEAHSRDDVKEDQIAKAHYALWRWMGGVGRQSGGFGQKSRASEGKGAETVAGLWGKVNDWG